MNNNKQPANTNLPAPGLPPAKFPVAILRNHPAPTNSISAPVLVRRTVQQEHNATQFRRLVEQARQPIQQQRTVQQGHQPTQDQGIVEQARQPIQQQRIVQQGHQRTQDQGIVEQTRQPIQQQRIVQQGHQPTQDQGIVEQTRQPIQQQRVVQQGHQRYRQHATTHLYYQIRPATSPGEERKYRLIQTDQPSASTRQLRAAETIKRFPSLPRKKKTGLNHGQFRLGTSSEQHQSQDLSKVLSSTTPSIKPTVAPIRGATVHYRMGKPHQKLSDHDNLILQHQHQVAKLPIRKSVQHVNRLEIQQMFDEAQDELFKSDNESQDDEGVQEGPMTYQQFIDKEYYDAQMELKEDLILIDEELD